MPFASRIGVCFGVAGIALALPYVLLDVIPFPWNRRSVIMDLDGRSGQLPAWLKINLLRSFFGAIPKSLSIARFLRHKELRQDEGLGILGLGIEARNVEVDATLERELLELTGAPEGASSIFYWEVWSFPMTIHLMAHARMPFPILGAVHFSNSSRFLDRQALALSPKVDVSAKVTGVEPHRRGSIVTVSTRVYPCGRSSDEDAALWETNSNFLFFHSRPQANHAPSLPSVEPETPLVEASRHQAKRLPPAEPEKRNAKPVVPAKHPTPTDASRKSKGEEQADRDTESVILESDLGLRYAMLNGDFNPIHVSDRAARAFGFQKMIVPGLCLLEKATNKLGLSGDLLDEIQVEFRKPVLIPGEATIHLFPGGRFEVRNSSDDVCQTGCLSGRQS